MKKHLQKAAKTLSILLVLFAVTSSCKKDKKEPVPETAKTMAKGTINGKAFKVDESAIASTIYTTPGDGVKSLQTSATLDADGNKLTFFLDDLKNGAIALTKKAGTSLNPGKNTIRINATTSAPQTYVQYYSGGNAYYAYEGKIEMILTETTITITWSINFKDATGKVFSSSGSFSITFASVVTKPKSEVTDPTPVADKPVIESIAPQQGRPGDTVAIAGLNFSTVVADNVVKFNGTNAEIKSATATKLVAIVPQGGTSGKVSVKVKNSEVTEGPQFSYIANATLGTITPLSGKVGDTVTVNGANFSTIITDNIVKFNGVQATVLTATTTKLTVKVPANATTGNVTLAVLGGTVLTGGPFTVTVAPPPTTGDWQNMDFTASLQESTISVASGGGFMFTGGSFPKYLYYSANGTGFKNVYDNIPSDKSMNLEIHLLKSDGVYYYLTTNQGIFRTKDGETWKKLTPYPASPNMSVTGLIAARGGNLTCMQGALLFKSADYGDTWTLSQATKPNNGTLDYFTSDSFGKYWYAVDLSSNYLNAPNPRKLYKSADGGKSWTAGAATTGIYFFGGGNQDFITASGYTIFALYSPSTASIADQRLYKTTNQGDTWTKVNDNVAYYVKAFGDYVVYGNGDFNVSVDNGNTFKKYDVPTGYQVGGVERSNGYFYIYAYTNNGGYKFRIFRKKI